MRLLYLPKNDGIPQWGCLSRVSAELRKSSKVGESLGSSNSKEPLLPLGLRGRGRGTGKGEGRRGGSSSPVTGEEGDGDADSWV